MNHMNDAYSERYQDFIGMYSNVFPDGYCDHMIKEYEYLESNGYCRTRKQAEGDEMSKFLKDDTHCFLNLKNTPIHTEFNGQDPMGLFHQTLQIYFEKYVDHYDNLKQYGLSCNSFKMQKIRPGGGYHVWHHEQGNGADNTRCLTYSFYLNTIEQSGEVEFLYQQLRIPAKENTLLIWPAAYTHPHRGNVVHGNKSKYIITGWFYLD